MLKKKALRKILITSFSLFTLLVVYLIPTKVNRPTLKNLNEEVIYTSNTTNEGVYLLGDNNYLVKYMFFSDKEKDVDKIKEIIDYLTIGSTKKLPSGLSGIIPKDTKVLDIQIDNDKASINFSKNLLEIEEEKEERMIEAIVYSITEIDNIEKVNIMVEGEELVKLPKSNKVLDKELTREFGINKVYDITNRNGIQKVTVYYLDKISNNNYYVPVTRYLNDDRDKIKIIIDNLASSYIHEDNLMSYLNSRTNILDYGMEDEMFVLDLSSDVLKNDVILESVEYTLSYSIFDNYDVDKILLKVDGNLLKEIEK